MHFTFKNNSALPWWWLSPIFLPGLLSTSSSHCLLWLSSSSSPAKPLLHPPSFELWVLGCPPQLEVMYVSCHCHQWQRYWCNWCWKAEELNKGSQYPFPVEHIMCAHSSSNHWAHSAGFRGSHSGTPVHTLLCTFFEPCKIRDFPIPLSERCTGEWTIGEKFPSTKVREGNYPDI